MPAADRAAACGGARLKPLSLAVTVGDRSISEVCDLSIGESAEFLKSLELSDDARIPRRLALSSLCSDLRMPQGLPLGFTFNSRQRASISA